MDSIAQDIRFAFRSLAKSPAFTAAAIVCVALGIAANVFIWTPLNTLLLRPMPFPNSERVMHLSTWRTTGERHTYGSWSYDDYRDVAELPGVFTAVGASQGRTWNVGGMEEPERVSGSRVSASLFPMLGLRAERGRLFRPDEEEAGRVAIISSGLWERRFASDPAVVGRSVLIDGEAHTIVGVMQRGVRYPEQDDLWLPLSPGALRGHRDWRVYQVVARLAPGVTVAQADARVAQLMRENAGRYPTTNSEWSSWIVPQNDLVAREVRAIFLIMLGAVGFVLLIACANVANLLLARGASRHREVAVRMAVGASRGRIVRQLLTESILLSIGGGVLGLLIGTWSVEFFTLRMMPTTVPYWMTFDVDRTVVLVTAGTTLLTGLVFGVVPAWQLSRPALGEALKDAGGRGSSGTARVGRTRATLVVTELALSLVLLVGAGLMVKSFLQTMQADLGFSTENLLTFDLAPTGTRYATDSARAAFRRVLDERLRAIPGVADVGAIDHQLVADCCSDAPYYPVGKEYREGGAPSANFLRVSPSYFSTLRVPVRRGRPIADADARVDAPVVVIDEMLAEREWPGESAIGKLLVVGAPTDAPRTVIGVVPNLVTRSVMDRRRPQLFVPLSPGAAGSTGIAVRGTGDAAALTTAVREAVKSIDPDLPLARLATMDFVVRDRMFQPRVFGAMFAIFASAALLLATIGLYGVMSYLVAQRTKELGVRIALGATTGDVMRLVLQGALRLIAIGFAIGIPAAVVLSQLLRGALYRVSATDPVTLIGVPLTLGAVALLASWVPARRATRVDPVRALRAD
ncbi:MAG: ABC transporter permease [Gemmatimonadaceae bacterium]